MLILNLWVDLSQEVRFLIYSIIHLIYLFDSKIGQPNFEIIELKKVIVLIRHSRDRFMLTLNDCIHSMSFIFFVSNINYIFTLVNLYI